MLFIVLNRTQALSSDLNDVAVLRYDNWNDSSFVTMFDITYYEKPGVSVYLGKVKIGYKNQSTEVSTYQKITSTIGSKFESLDESYFSLGQSDDYYKKIAALPDNTRRELLEKIRDIVFKQEIIDKILDENVFGVSLLRDLSISTISGKFNRILNGSAEHVSYHFKFSYGKVVTGVELNFRVFTDKKPPTNIHAIIGKNGVGKTTLLSDMVISILSKNGKGKGKFYDCQGVKPQLINTHYFSRVISVSFSAFDSFEPPSEQPDPSQGPCYFYVGLKKPGCGTSLQTRDELYREFAESLIQCFTRENKK